jgi:hypothetical protein
MRASGPAILVAIVFVVCQIPAHAGTSFITNGNFADGLTNGTAINIYGSSVNSLTGWTESSTPSNGSAALAFLYTYGSQADSITDHYGTNDFTMGDPSAIPNTWTGACATVTIDCGNYVVIDGGTSNNMALQQTLTGLTTGATYQLTFYMAAGEQNKNTVSTTGNWQVTLGNSTLTSATSTNPGGTSGGFSGWSLVTMNFSFSGSQVLTFLAQGTPSGDPPMVFLADVNLTQVATPEPAGMALIGIGMLGLVLMRRRWQKRA